MKVSLRGLVLGFVLAAACPAYAQESPLPPLERGVSDGKFVDQYYGIRYKGKGLERRKKVDRLFSGRLADGTLVDIRVAESTRPLSGVEWREQSKERWKREKRQLEGYAEGKTPHAWARFRGKDEEGQVVQFGFAYYPRGLQVFIVQARAQPPGDQASERVTEALENLTVDAETKDAFRLAGAAGAKAGKDPRSPEILIRAAVEYAQAGRNQNRELAAAAVKAADRNASVYSKAGKLTPELQWDLAFYGATVDLARGEFKQAVQRSEQCVPLAKQLKAGRRVSACHYNLARAYAGLDRKDEAFEELAASIEADDGNMRAFVTQQAGVQPDFEKLRGDARWKKLFSAAAPKAP